MWLAEGITRERVGDRLQAMTDACTPDDGRSRRRALALEGTMVASAFPSRPVTSRPWLGSEDDLAEETLVQHGAMRRSGFRKRVGTVDDDFEATIRDEPPESGEDRTDIRRLRT